MRRSLLAGVFVTAAVAVAAGCGGGGGGGSYGAAETDTTAGDDTTSGGAPGTLSGAVGPGFDISMAESTVAAGTYSLTVDDQGTAHDFHLTGAGVDITTGVSGTGKKTFTVALQPGSYTFVCDPHSASMNGTLTVT